MNRSGLTLLELVVALSLSSMLIALLFTTISNLKRQQEVIVSQVKREPWKQLLVKQIQNDYRQCRSVLVRPKLMLLEGFYPSESEDGFYEELKQVRYRIQSNEDGNWLYREARDLSNGEITRELVCKGVTEFRSLDQLSTDVAPGCLRIQLNWLADTEAQSKSTVVSLVRHGGIE